MVTRTHEAPLDAPTPARCGARTLEHLRQRCRIDAETGCWIWTGAVSRMRKRKAEPSTRVWLPDVDRPGVGQLMTAGKAAWLLAGKPLAPGQVVWRHVCHEALCINPEHAKAVTRAEMGAGIRASGINRGDPKRSATNLRNALSSAVPRERVVIVEKLLAEGVTCAAIRRALGMSQETVAAIRDGVHINSTRYARTVPAASVFALGTARP